MMPRHMTQPGATRRVAVVAAAVLLVRAVLQGAEAQQPDSQTRATQLAKSKTAQVLYSPVEKAAVEGVSLVRYVYGPAEYVLLGAPALALSLANGGPLGLATKVSFDIVSEMIRESLEHPEKASRKIARSAYDMGLKAYRDNYRLYGKVKTGEPLSTPEARDFLVNWHVQDYMAAAKRLYNAASAYEGKAILKRMDKALLQQMEATAVAQAREAFGARAGVEVSALLKATKLEFTVFESVVRGSIGLGAYPPYQEFLRNTRNINAALARDVGKRPEGPTTLTVEGTARAFIAALNRKDVAAMLAISDEPFFYRFQRWVPVEKGYERPHREGEGGFIRGRPEDEVVRSSNGRAKFFRRRLFRDETIDTATQTPSEDDLRGIPISLKHLRFVGFLTGLGDVAHEMFIGVEPVSRKVVAVYEN